MSSKKEPPLFTKYFSGNYIGVANDGVKNAAAEVEGILKLDIKEIEFSKEKISFPEPHLAIMTFKMIVSGKLKETEISGTIYCSTVYLKKTKNGGQFFIQNLKPANGYRLNK